MTSVWRRSAVPFAVGVLLGATCIGVLIAPISALVALLPTAATWWVAAGAGFVLYTVEIAGQAHHLPQNRRLVPQSVMYKDKLVGPVQFGFELGTGVRTYVPTALPLTLVLMVVLLGPGYLELLFSALSFGAGRLLLPLVRNRYPRRWDEAIGSNERSFTLILLHSFVLCAFVAFVAAYPS